MPVIAFHFDFLSPYAYLAWNALPTLAARHGREIRPVPTLLAALLAHGQTKGPAEIPAKRLYTFKDVLRSAALLGVPLVPPPTHPFNPLLALRVAGQLDGDAQRTAIDALFTATWGGGRGCEDPAEVAAALSIAGLDGEALLRAGGTPEAKAKLRADTEAAIGAGVFGVPTMRVDGELFWGLDSFGHLERFLAGDDPLRGVDLSRWATIRASAAR